MWIDKDDYTVKISSRKFTDKLFDQLKIKSKDQISTTTSSFDKVDRLDGMKLKNFLEKVEKINQEIIQKAQILIMIRLK